MHYSTIDNTQTEKANQMSIDKWMDKEVTHFHNIKESKWMPFVVTCELGNNMVYSTKWGKSEKDKHHLYVKRKNWFQPLIYERKEMVTKGEGRMGYIGRLGVMYHTDI